MRYVSAGFIIIGVVILAYLTKNDSFYLTKQEQWPTLKGRILESRLVTASENAETGESTFKPIIKYTYTNRGEVFNENRLTPMGKPYKSRTKAKQIVARFQPNTEVDVYVNPNPLTSPKSVLIWELPDTLNPMVGIAGVLLISGVLGFLFIGVRAITSKNAA